MRALPKSTYVSLLLPLLILTLGLVVAGCTDIGGTDDTGAGEATTTIEAGGAGIADVSTDTLDTTTTLPPAVTVTTLHADASEESLPSGRVRACGIIKRVWMDGSTRKLEIDYVDFLVGAAADAAALADGVITPGEHVDNDYYVSNKNTKLRTFSVSGEVGITTFSRAEPIDAPEPCSWNDFYDFWNLVGPPLPNDFGLSEGLWWIERDSTGVVAIEQQWVP